MRDAKTLYAPRNPSGFEADVDHYSRSSPPTRLAVPRTSPFNDGLDNRTAKQTEDYMHELWVQNRSCQAQVRL